MMLAIARLSRAKISPFYAHLKHVPTLTMVKTCSLKSTNEVLQADPSTIR